MGKRPISIFRICKRGTLKDVKDLIDDKKIAPPLLFKISITNNRSDVINLLYKEYRYRPYNQKDLLQAIEMMPSAVHMDIVDVLLEYSEGNHEILLKAISRAAQIGRLDVLEKIVQKYNPILNTQDIKDHPLCLAALYGNLDIVKYLNEKCGCNSKNIGDIALHLAAINNHLEVCIYLFRECGYTLQNNNTLSLALRHKNIDLIKFLIEEANLNPHYNNENALYLAVEYNCIDIVKYLVEVHNCNPHIMNDILVYKAGNQQDCVMLRYLIKECNCDFSLYKDHLLYQALESGNLSFLKFLHEECGIKEYNSTYCSVLSKHKNDKDFIKYVLINIKGKWDTSVFSLKEIEDLVDSTSTEHERSMLLYVFGKDSRSKVQEYAQKQFAHIQEELLERTYKDIYL